MITGRCSVCGTVHVKQEATIGLTVTDWREQERLLQSRIAELEAALAEERAKPKEGARRFSSKRHLHNRDEWVCNENRLAWSEAFVVGGFVGPDAERHASEHAAKLQAEWSAKSPTDDAKGVE